MKSKYSGLITAGIFALAAGISIVYGFQDFEPQRPDVRVRSNRILPQANLPDESVLKQVDGLQQEMAQLISLPAPEEDIVDLIALGQPPDPAAAHYDRSNGNDGKSPAAYRLTLVFCSQNKNFCIIDGRFTSEGGLLPDGASVVRIEPHRVLLKKGAVLEWIYPDQEKLFSGQYGAQEPENRQMEVQ
jgi:hypothetical protein